MKNKTIMKKKTIGTLFSGGELFGIGARAAGFDHAWGVELDPKIAEVARLNGFNVYTGDIRDFVPTRKSKKGVMQNKITKDICAFVDHLHASPPCPNYSQAKTGGEETPLDLEIAGATCEFIRTLHPFSFSLENVTDYQNGEAFKMITKCLMELGYFYDWENVNAADFGVPQTRRRMILRARRDSLLSPYPPPVKWVGWYEAIEDLIPTLPDSKFAPWQLERLPEEYATLLTQATSYNPETSRGKIYRDPEEPAATILVKNDSMKAFIMESKFPDRNGSLLREGNAVTGTVTALDPSWKAFIADGQPNANGERLTVRDGESPVFTLQASGDKKPLRAFVVSGGNSNANTFTARESDEPITTITGSMEKTPSRAFIVDTKQVIRESTVGDEENPIYTLAASSAPYRNIAALPNGRIVKMTLKCLARFQTVPDDYIGLTTKINGNGVPCKLAEGIMRTFL